MILIWNFHRLFETFIKSYSVKFFSYNVIFSKMASFLTFLDFCQLWCAITPQKITITKKPESMFCNFLFLFRISKQLKNLFSFKSNNSSKLHRSFLKNFDFVMTSSGNHGNYYLFSMIFLLLLLCPLNI